MCGLSHLSVPQCCIKLHIVTSVLHRRNRRPDAQGGPTIQFMRLARKSGISKHERYIDASAHKQ
jgi:hypothetical protein